MKKLIFCTLSLAALSFLFTACEPGGKNQPDEPENDTTAVDPQSDIKASDYAGTKWRIDSCLENGAPVHGPHFFIDVKTDKEVILNGYDTTTFVFQEGFLIIHPESEEPWKVQILKATKDYAELKAQFGTLYLSRIPDMEGDKLTPSRQNIVGTWKWDWFYTENYHWIYEWQKWYTDYTIGTTAGVETWEFREDGTLVQVNTMNAMWDAKPVTIWWEFNEETKQIAWGYDETKPDPIPDSYWMSVELTQHVMHVRKYDPSQHDEGYQDHRWYFSR